MLKPYQENIKKIENEIQKIGYEIVEANNISLNALKSNDLSLLNDVNLSIKTLSLRSSEIDNLIVKTLALYSPEAKDLREMVSFLKVTNELLRAGSNSKMFVKTFKKYFTENIEQKAILEYSIPLLKASNSALEIAVSSIKVTNELELETLHKNVSVEENKTDDLYVMVEKSILKLITKNIDISKDYFEVLSSLRRLEKTADRAVSISNLIVYAKLGGTIEQS